jgi:hypothetical protein
MIIISGTILVCLGAAWTQSSFLTGQQSGHDQFGRVRKTPC